MSWDKVDRRRAVGCPLHEELSKNISQLAIDTAVIKERIIALDSRINGSIDAIEKHIEHGNKWRMSIVAVAVTLFLSLGGGLIVWAQNLRQISINTGRLDKLEDLQRYGRTQNK